MCLQKLHLLTIQQILFSIMLQTYVNARKSDAYQVQAEATKDIKSTNALQANTSMVAGLENEPVSKFYY